MLQETAIEELNIHKIYFKTRFILPCFFFNLKPILFIKRLNLKSFLKNLDEHFA